MKNYAHIASRVLNTPLLLEPSYARTFFSALSTQLNINSLVDAEAELESLKSQELLLKQKIIIFKLQNEIKALESDS
jgi:hypothetical protein